MPRRTLAQDHKMSLRNGSNMKTLDSISKRWVFFAGSSLFLPPPPKKLKVWELGEYMASLWNPRGEKQFINLRTSQETSLSAGIRAQKTCVVRAWPQANKRSHQNNSLNSCKKSHHAGNNTHLFLASLLFQVLLRIFHNKMLLLEKLRFIKTEAFHEACRNKQQPGA